MYNSAELFPGCGALRFIFASCFQICVLQLVSKILHFNVTSSRSTCSDKLAQNRREEGVGGGLSRWLLIPMSSVYIVTINVCTVISFKTTLSLSLSFLSVFRFISSLARTSC